MNFFSSTCRWIHINGDNGFNRDNGDHVIDGFIDMDPLIMIPLSPSHVIV